MKTFKLWSDVISTWVTILGLFAGGVFALWQYHDKVVSDRVGAALAFVDRYNKSPVQDAKTKLEAEWERYSADIMKKTDAGENELSRFVIGVVQQRRLQTHVAALSEFYDNLQVCTCAKLCDEETVIRFFGKRAYDFYGLHAPYIVSTRRLLKDHSFGYGAESIAISYVRNQSVRKHSCADKRPAVKAGG